MFIRIRTILHVPAYRSTVYLHRWYFLFLSYNNNLHLNNFNFLWKGCVLPEASSCSYTIFILYLFIIFLIVIFNYRSPAHFKSFHGRKCNIIFTFFVWRCQRTSNYWCKVSYMPKKCTIFFYINNNYVVTFLLSYFLHVLYLLFWSIVGITHKYNYTTIFIFLFHFA